MISVLFVDDDPDLLESARQFLEQSGDFCVGTATSVPEALDSPGIRSYDAIVSAYRMPGMDGIAFLKAVRERLGDVPFILYTGSGSEEVATEAVNNRADGYLRKGSDPKSRFAELSTRIQQAVKMRQEEAIRASEEKFRILVENSLDGIVIVDLAGVLLFANRAAGSIVEARNYPAMVGKKNVLDYVAPESRADVLRDFRSIVEGVDAYLVHYKLITATQRGIWVECIGKKIRFRKSDAIFISLRDVTERKRAEELAWESGEKFAMVFRSSPVALTLVSAEDGIFVDVNEAFVHETGYARQDVIGKTADRVGLFPDDRERERMIAALRNRQNVQGMEVSCRIKTGGIRTCQFSTRIILMGGKPHILSTIEDITDRKAAEEELRKSRQLLAEAMDMAHLVNWEYDPATNLFAFDDRFYALYGTTAEREGGNHMTPETYIREFVHPEDRDIVEREVNNARQEPGSPDESQLEHRIIRRDGGIRHIVVRIGVTKDPDGRVIRTRGANQDITDRKNSEEALRESEEKFRSLVETSPGIIWEIDVQGTFRYISPMTGPVMGYPPEELIGKSIADLVADRKKTFAVQELARLVSSDAPCLPFEVPTRHRDGRDLVVEIRPARMTDKNGKLTGFRGVALDVTERKNAEVALRRANRQLTLLTNITRHDILNKITVALGFLKIAEKKCTDAVQADYLRKVRETVTAIRSQIEFTRVYQNLGTHEPQWICLDEVIPRSQVPAAIALITDIKGTVVFADPMLEKVFSNLLDNTVHHGQRVTQIRMSARPSGKDLVVVWEDNGVGIAADEKEQIFERGFGKHTGLGLFLVREILSLTGIAIAETGEPGNGARFEIRVPEGMWRITGDSAR